MDGKCSTQQAGLILGISPTALQQRIWAGRLEAPERKAGRNFRFGVDDLCRVAEAFGVEMTSDEIMQEMAEVLGDSKDAAWTNELTITQ